MSLTKEGVNGSSGNTNFAAVLHGAEDLRLVRRTKIMLLAGPNVTFN